MKFYSHSNLALVSLVALALSGCSGSTSLSYNPSYRAPIPDKIFVSEDALDRCPSNRLKVCERHGPVVVHCICR